MDTKSHAAAISTIFFIFAYSPAYNTGYNALTYSEYTLFEFRRKHIADSSL